MISSTMALLDEYRNQLEYAVDTLIVIQDAAMEGTTCGEKLNNAIFFVSCALQDVQVNISTLFDKLFEEMYGDECQREIERATTIMRDML